MKAWTPLLVSRDSIHHLGHGCFIARGPELCGEAVCELDGGTRYDLWEDAKYLPSLIFARDDTYR